MSCATETALESWDCPVGCGATDGFVLSGHDRLHGMPGDFRVVKCSRCGLMRTDPRPTAEAMSRYYPDDYGPYLSTRIVDEGEDRRPQWRRRASRLTQIVTNTNADRIPPMPVGRLLEIGCASGSYLHKMAKAGWSVEGMELSRLAAERAQLFGHRVHVGSVESAPEPPRRFDLIVGWMVLEHLRDPVHALRRLHDWTNPGGWLVASVPNAGCWEFEIFKSAWFALQVPNHLWHPTRETLKMVLERGGWKLQRAFFHRDLRNILGSLGYILEDRGWFPGVAAWLKGFPERGGRLSQVLFPASWLLALIGQTGRMTIWARRAE
jgi:2-polyprenyl-3-methyl-5-hydroxy-6-metoxy-1,4-benzoquinol methylase